jgi:Amt family ammonium transporter
MFESGLVRAKNTVEILTKNVCLFAIASIMYLLLGFHIMYSSQAGGILPSFGWLIGTEHPVSYLTTKGQDGSGYSARANFFFQMMFTATAMSIVSGAVAERMKLWAFLLFAVVMTAFIYPVQGFWTWGGGFLARLGFHDFAGSGVVHLCGASAALAGVLLLGPRAGKYGKQGQINAICGANLPLAALGTFILWIGWFGFNGGSVLHMTDFTSANQVAQVLVNTNLAAAGGVVAALILARLLFGKSDLTMCLNGALAGLVAITADPVFPAPWQAVLIGAVGGLLVVCFIVILDKLKIDDPVGAIAVHGVAGIWALLITAFTDPQATLAGQLLGIVVIFAWTFILSLAVWFVLKITMGIRVQPEDEELGLDVVDCGIEAYPEFNGKN